MEQNYPSQQQYADTIAKLMPSAGAGLGYSKYTSSKRKRLDHLYNEDGSKKNALYARFLPAGAAKGEV